MALRRLTNRAVGAFHVAPVAGWLWLLVSGLTIAAFALRLDGSAIAPANGDEYAWSWAGISLIGGRGPTSWSYLGLLFHAPHYGQPVWIHLHGAWFPIVHPWMDHPPAFALVVGAAAWIAGQHSFAQVELGTIRLPVIALATLSVPLVFELGRRAVGPGAGLGGAAMLALSPVAVRFGQVAEAEVMLMPVFLGTLILTDVHLARRDRNSLVGCLVLCTLAVLVKVSGISVGASVAAAFLIAGRFKPALMAVLAVTCGFLLFALYGLAFGWDAWVGAFVANTSRAVGGLETAYQLLTSNAGPVSHAGPLLDWWWWIGLFAIAGLRQRRQFSIVVMPAIVYVAFYTIAGNGLVGVYGWYRWPLFAFFYIAAGAVLLDLAKAAQQLGLRYLGLIRTSRSATAGGAAESVSLPIDNQTGITD